MANESFDAFDGARVAAETQELAEDELAEDELVALFSAFDDVSASDKLQAAALERIAAQADEERAAVTVTAGGRAAKQRKWRAIRTAAVAACLAAALAGGFAYATPATYYEVVQEDTTITLGVNCFGITVKADADTDAGKDIVKSTDLQNMPYGESITHAIESLEERDPSKPIEFGPRGGEHESVPPRGEASGGKPGEEGAPDADGAPGDPGSRDDFAGKTGQAGEGGLAPEPTQNAFRVPDRGAGDAPDGQSGHGMACDGPLPHDDPPQPPAPQTQGDGPEAAAENRF